MDSNLNHTGQYIPFFMSLTIEWFVDWEIEPSLIHIRHIAGKFMTAGLPVVT